MDNISGNAKNWPGAEETTKKIKKDIRGNIVVGKKISKRSFNKLHNDIDAHIDAAIKSTNELYELHKDKYLYDLLVQLKTAKSSNENVTI